MRRDRDQIIVGIVFALVVLFLLGSCIRWEWRECRQVGHGKLYCFAQMGRK
jgi:hypothetical protein